MYEDIIEEKNTEHNSNQCYGYVCEKHGKIGDATMTIYSGPVSSTYCLLCFNEWIGENLTDLSKKGN